MASATFVRGASLDETIAADFRSLVGSIVLPPDVAARIREIIARCATTRAALPAQITERGPAPTTDGGTMIPGLWSRLILLHAERDAAIRSLLTDAAHQQAFDVNAAAMQRQLDAIRPRWAT